jgi:hypothetical protein
MEIHPRTCFLVEAKEKLNQLKILLMKFSLTPSFYPSSPFNELALLVCPLNLMLQNENDFVIKKRKEDSV